MAARIAALPREDLAAALAELTTCLDELAQVPRAELAGSLGALELLDQAARSHYRDATRRYLHQLEPSLEDPLAPTVEACLIRLAQRYQSNVVLWRTSAAKHPLPRTLLVCSLTGGVRACAAVLKWSYLRRTAGPVGVWADMSTLYAAAEAAGCTRTPSQWKYSAGESCVEREFLKGCMLAAGAPDTLSPVQVDIAERLAGYCSPDLGLASGIDERYPWFIDLEAGDPPARLDPVAPTPTRARSFGIDSDERFRRLLHLVETDRLPPAAFGAQLEKASVMQTLRQLAHQWLPGGATREPLAA